MTQQPHPTAPTSSPASTYETCIVFMLGYPAMGKRTIGAHVSALLDAVLVDNQLVYRPLVELFRWDGIAPLPPQIWERVIPIRQAVLGVIEDLAPATNSYVFTNVLVDEAGAAAEYDQLRSLAKRRGSLFLAVMLTCDIDVQVSRIANPDRVALRKGSDPQGYRRHRLTTDLFQPPASEVIHLDTTETTPTTNAQGIYQALHERGYAPTTQALPTTS